MQSKSERVYSHEKIGWTQEQIHEHEKIGGTQTHNLAVTSRQSNGSMTDLSRS